MLMPIVWVPLDFFDDIVIRLHRLLSIGLTLLLVEPSVRYCCYRFTSSCGVRQTTLR
jgi:hypothetical protein